LLVGVIVILSSFCCCKRVLDGLNCGPAALSASLVAMRTIPTNQPIKDPNAAQFKLGVSQTNSALGRCVVHCFCCSCCIAGTGIFVFAIIVAINGGLPG